MNFQERISLDHHVKLYGGQKISSTESHCTRSSRGLVNMVTGTICVRCTAWQDQGTKGDCVCVAEEDYLRDGLNKTDAIVSSLDLNQAVTEVIPVVFSLAKKGCLLFLVELRKTHTVPP